MKLVIENGGSKLDWILIGENSIKSVNAISSFDTDVQILNQLKVIFQSFKFEISDLEIDFYTAGLTGSFLERIKNIFLENFSVKSINFFSDMLAASRALFKDQKGISCILGTGSNCAYFDGVNNHEITFSTGYLLGDEGSGYDLGKRFLQFYFQKKTPNYIKKDFEITMNMNCSDILSAIYSVSNPKFYIANFTRFIQKHQNDPFIADMIQTSFLSFLNKHPFTYPEFNKYKFGFVGSIAFYFSDHIDSIMKQHDVDYIILQKPIDNLTCYYLD